MSEKRIIEKFVNSYLIKDEIFSESIINDLSKDLRKDFVLNESSFFKDFNKILFSCFKKDRNEFISTIQNYKSINSKDVTSKIKKIFPISKNGSNIQKNVKEENQPFFSSSEYFLDPNFVLYAFNLLSESFEKCTSIDNKIHKILIYKKKEEFTSIQVYGFKNQILKNFMREIKNLIKISIKYYKYQNYFDFMQYGLTKEVKERYFPYEKSRSKPAKTELFDIILQLKDSIKRFSKNVPYLDSFYRNYEVKTVLSILKRSKEKDHLCFIRNSNFYCSYFEFQKYTCHNYKSIQRRLEPILYRNVDFETLYKSITNINISLEFCRAYSRSGYKENLIIVYKKHLSDFKTKIDNLFSKNNSSENPLIMLYVLDLETSKVSQAILEAKEIFLEELSSILKNQEILNAIASFIDKIMKNTVKLESVFEKIFEEHTSTISQRANTHYEKILRGFGNKREKGKIEKDVMLCGKIIDIPENHKNSVISASKAARKLYASKFQDCNPDLFLKVGSDEINSRIINAALRVLCWKDLNFEDLTSENLIQKATYLQHLAFESCATNEFSIELSFPLFYSDPSIVKPSDSNIISFTLLDLFSFVSKCLSTLQDIDLLQEKLRIGLASRLLTRQYLYKREVALLSFLSESCRHKMIKMLEEISFKEENKMFFVKLSKEEIKFIDEAVSNTQNIVEQSKSFLGSVRDLKTGKQCDWKMLIEKFLLEKYLEEDIQNVSFMNSSDLFSENDPIASDVKKRKKNESLSVSDDLLKNSIDKENSQKNQSGAEYIFSKYRNRSKYNELELKNSKFNRIRSTRANEISDSVFLMKMCRWPKFDSAKLNFPELNAAKEILSSNLALDGVKLAFNDLLGSARIQLCGKEISVSIFQYSILQFFVQNGGKISLKQLESQVQDIFTKGEISVKNMTFFEMQYSILFEFGILKKNKLSVFLNSEFEEKSYLPTFSFLYGVEEAKYADSEGVVDNKIVNEAKVMHYLKEKKEVLKPAIKRKFPEIENLNEILESLSSKDLLEIVQNKIIYLP